MSRDGLEVFTYILSTYRKEHIEPCHTNTPYWVGPFLPNYSNGHFSLSGTTLRVVACVVPSIKPSPGNGGRLMGLKLIIMFNV